jgi:hypothetical protein
MTWYVPPAILAALRGYQPPPALAGSCCRRQPLAWCWPIRHFL